MNWSIHFAYPYVLYALLPLLCCAVWYRWNYYKAPRYIFPLTDLMRSSGVTLTSMRQAFFTGSRFIILTGFVLLLARPQLVDEKSKVTVEGIDILLALDVSGSMQLFDDPDDKKQRIAVAKEEAINFINQRDNDPIGLVIFGKEAVSRCPLTLDKKVLESIINDIEIGVVNAEGTVISKALATALNRLKDSEAATKIIILLTDGEPTPGDLDPRDVVFLAKKYGVKIYTIGIGGKYGGLIDHPIYGMQPIGIPINTDLLDMLAKETGGKSFLASNQKELQNIYHTIDMLEKTEYETDVYHDYHDIFMPFLWALFALIALEEIVATFVWFGL